VDPDQQIIVSTISFWEVSAESALVSWRSTASLRKPADACLQIGFDIRHLSPEDSSDIRHSGPLPIIWQAIRMSYERLESLERGAGYQIRLQTSVRQVFRSEAVDLQLTKGNFSETSQKLIVLTMIC